jgi:hypothetical protein
MTKWPQLTPSAIGLLTPDQAIDLLAESNPQFKNRSEYIKWAQQRKR